MVPNKHTINLQTNDKVPDQHTKNKWITWYRTSQTQKKLKWQHEPFWVPGAESQIYLLFYRKPTWTASSLPNKWSLTFTCSSSFLHLRGERKRTKECIFSRSSLNQDKQDAPVSSCILKNLEQSSQTNLWQPVPQQNKTHRLLNIINNIHTRQRILTIANQLLSHEQHKLGNMKQEL